MFTGIIEEVGVLEKIEKKNSNLILTIRATFLDQIQINQSISHNGVCLTVTKINEKSYTVCVVKETINKTNISFLKKHDTINLERCLSVGGRFDGHFVQGHVDCYTKCLKIKNMDGSWVFQFKYPENCANYLVPKGSIAINGISLTISKIDTTHHSFETTIIPYTFNHTNFKKLKTGNHVNIEFDLINKQVARLFQNNRTLF